MPSSDGSIAQAFLTESFRASDLLLVDFHGAQARASQAMEAGSLVEFEGGQDPGSFQLSLDELRASSSSLQATLETYEELLELAAIGDDVSEFRDALRTAASEKQDTIPDPTIPAMGIIIGPLLIWGRPSRRHAMIGTVLVCGLLLSACGSDDSTDVEDSTSVDLTSAGVGYDAIGGEDVSLASILEAQQAGIVDLLARTDETIAELEAALPAAESGEFVSSIMGEEGHPFMVAFDQLVRERSRFVDFYTQSCMVTIDAMNAIYPLGMEFMTGE